MSDRYADIQEMSRYGNHFVSAAANYLSLDPFVGTLANGQQALLDQVAGLSTMKQGSTSTFVMSRKDQRALSEQARSLLDSLFSDLEAAQKKGIAFDFSTFFPTRTRRSIGKSIADRQAAVTRCINGLALYPQIPDAAGWKTNLEDLQKQFSGVVSSTSGSDSSKRSDVKAFEQLRRQWKRHYLACKRGMEAVLLLAGRELELKGLFLDLQQSKAGSSDGESAAQDGEAAPAATA
jgi:hypothetical protein